MTYYLLLLGESQGCEKIDLLSLGGLFSHFKPRDIR